MLFSSGFCFAFIFGSVTQREVDQTQISSGRSQFYSSIKLATAVNFTHLQSLFFTCILRRTLLAANLITLPTSVGLIAIIIDGLFGHDN
jgi:hypothetical protein